VPCDGLQPVPSVDLGCNVDAIQEDRQRYAVAGLHALPSHLLDVVRVTQRLAVVDDPTISLDIDRLGSQVVLHSTEGEVKAVDRAGVGELVTAGDARGHYRSSSITTVENRTASALPSSPSTDSN